MAIRSEQEFFDMMRERIGDDTSDSALSFMEDVRDTYNSLKDNSSIDWKQKYEQNDADWRQKYRDRFFDNVDAPPIEEPPIEKPQKKLTYESLFKED